nr:unnamed protein product [Callosobruchus analis]
MELLGSSSLVSGGGGFILGGGGGGGGLMCPTLGGELVEDDTIAPRYSLGSTLYTIAAVCILDCSLIAYRPLSHSPRTRKT